MSLGTANTQKSEVFLLRISSRNVDVSVVTCRYPHIYNFSFRKEFLETWKVYLSRILITNPRTPSVKNKFQNTFCVSSL